MNWLPWLLLNLFSIAILAFYSMLEMASVSFNKVRLQYYVSKGMKRAVWLSWLLENPTRLFGTTLIGVNVATVFGSEFAREFHAAIGINPDLSPISQVFLVVIFGELAPMFAARRYAEHVVMLGVPLVYASAKIMTPILWAFGGISRLYNWLMKVREAESALFLTQEELVKILEEEEDSQDINAVSENIFKMRLKTARQVMEPLSEYLNIPSNFNVSQVIDLLSQSEQFYVLIHHRELTNIIGIVHVRDLLRALPSKRAQDYARSPWFVTQSSSVMQILNQFRNNSHELAIILNPNGKAEGVVHLDDIVEEIFGQTNYTFGHKRMFIERTFPGDLTVGEFNRQFHVLLDKQEELTLSELMVNQLGHHPEVGESIELPPFELTVVETRMMEVKSIKVKG